MKKKNHPFHRFLLALQEEGKKEAEFYLDQVRYKK